MFSLSRPVLIPLCALALLALSACGSTPAARFYTLTSLPQGPVSPGGGSAGRQGIVAVGPVELADYLDRPQILVRSSPTALAPLEYDRWAGSLQSDLSRVLVENLALLLAPEGLMVLPWEETAENDGRVQVSVTRLEGTGEGTVVLSALWTLHGREGGEILSAARVAIVEPAAGSGAEARVEAMSRALAELSRQIAGEVTARLARPEETQAGGSNEIPR